MGAQYSITDIVGKEDSLERSKHDHLNFNLKVSMPCIIQSFNPTEQTVTVQPAIRERIKDQNGNLTWVQLSLLVDVPIVLPKAGGFVLTMPISKGDECLVIFADSCIDSWWASGGIQNWNDKRRHDLSDGFAILGTWSQPNIISNYSTSTCQLRNLAGTEYIELTNSGINLVGNVNITGTVVTSSTIVASGAITGSNLISGTKSVTGHTHSGVQSGSSTTGAF